MPSNKLLIQELDLTVKKAKLILQIQEKTQRLIHAAPEELEELKLQLKSCRGQLRLMEQEN